MSVNSNNAGSPNKDEPFWKTKSLLEMNIQEWESLCDNCGKCCLQQIEDERTKQLVFTDVACDLFDQKTCHCTDYKNRTSRVPNCLRLDANNVFEAVEFAPLSCAYRLLTLNQDLPYWHHLRSGDKQTVHREGLSVKNRTRSMASIDEEKIEDYVVEWPNNEL